MKAKENAWFLHTQEVRGSSPCAPTILIKGLRGLRARPEWTVGYKTSCFFMDCAEWSKKSGHPSYDDFDIATDNFQPPAAALC